MDELKELKERLLAERPQEWEDFPDIGLYMDQIISYMPRQLIHYGDSETLTSAMVNNYIKDGMLPRAEGKRYSRTHLAYLTAICALKQVLSVREASLLIGAGVVAKDNEHLYAYFRSELDRALRETGQALDEDTTEQDLPKLALGLALRSYADKLACERILDIICERKAPEKPKKDSKGGHKTEEATKK